MEQISNLLFWISSGLLVPVVAGLLYFFIKSILMLGGFCNKYIQRTRQEKVLAERLDALDNENVYTFKEQLQGQPATSFVSAAREILNREYNPAFVNRAISGYEMEAEKDLGRAKMLIKFGPVLGLMGTLIPMGPALAGLSSGDISSMAYNMQVAFATTVLGLFAGAVGFVLLQIKQRWVNADLYRLDFLAELAGQHFRNGSLFCDSPEFAGKRA